MTEWVPSKNQLADALTRGESIINVKSKWNRKVWHWQLNASDFTKTPLTSLFALIITGSLDIGSLISILQPALEANRGSKAYKKKNANYKVIKVFFQSTSTSEKLRDYGQRKFGLG